MLSHQPEPVPHRGQRDGGRTTDCLGSAPHRRMQTLRKLPITAPNSRGDPDDEASGRSGVTRDLVQENAGGDRHVE